MIMNKKGVEEAQLLLITYLVLNVVILLSLLYIVQKQLDGPDASKTFISKDHALILDTLYNSNGDIELAYSSKNKYEFIYKKNTAMVKTEKLTDTPASYKYSENGIYNPIDISLKNYDDKSEKSCKILFKKTKTDAVAIEKTSVCNGEQAE